MKSFFKRHKRTLTRLSLAVFFGISGIIIMSANIELTGSLFLLSSMGVFLYALVFRFFMKSTSSRSIHIGINKEIFVVSILVSTFFLIGAIESIPNYLEMTGIFVLSLILVLGLCYFKFKNHPLIFPFWIFFIGIIIIIALLDEYLGDKEIFNLATLGYFFFLFFLIVRWFFKQIKSITILKNEQKKTELIHLKSQVNPHFFFNTLNNLYGLVGKDAKKAQSLILKLSDMMRYSIYEGQKDSVTLEKEVEYLKNYIELHKMRYHKKIEVIFNTNIETKGCSVMPLLFIMLLENAFKHGVENLRTNAYVHLRLVTIGNEIHFEIENNFDPSEAINQSGIGIKNLKRRLKLVYPNKHTLDFFVKENVYRAQLIVKL